MVDMGHGHVAIETKTRPIDRHCVANFSGQFRLAVILSIRSPITTCKILGETMSTRIDHQVENQHLSLSSKSNLCALYARYFSVDTIKTELATPALATETD